MTAPHSSPITRALASVEGVSALDAPADVIAGPLRALLDNGIGDALRGSWLGHPLHPVAVTVPIGVWTAAPVFDLLRQPLAAQRLVLIGLGAAMPAAVTGLAEFTTLDAPQRRVAVVHASSNSVAMTLLVGSMLLRRKGRRLAAIGLTLAGLSVTGVSGALGGHLAYVQGAGVQREARPSVTADPYDV